MISTSKYFSPLCGLLLAATMLSAADPPFTEDFADGFSNWADGSLSFGLDYIESGGPDGNGYLSDQFSFAAASDEDDVTIFRAHDVFDSSGDAFVGNWITDGVGGFSAMVRHDLPLPINFFTRFASPSNFPGAIAVEFAPVLSNTWTEISFEISETNPEFVSFEGMTFADVFSAVGNVQVGVRVPDGFGGNPQSFTIDLDVASITPIPEPATIMPATLLALGIGLIRRQ